MILDPLRNVYARSNVDTYVIAISGMVQDMHVRPGQGAGLCVSFCIGNG